MRGRIVGVKRREVGWWKVVVGVVVEVVINCWGWLLKWL